MNSVGITIITSDGERNFSDPADLYSAIGSLYQAVNQCNLKAAMAYFALGEMLIKSHEQWAAIGNSLTLGHLMSDAGVHHRKGERAMRFYKKFIDPETGGFSMAIYSEAKHAVADGVANKTQKARMDANGNPSVRAVEVATGLVRTKCSGDVSDTCVGKPFSTEGYVDPCPGQQSDMDRALAGLAQDQDRDHDDDELDAPTPPRMAIGDDKPTGAAGEQMMIDFDFRADGRAIHEQLDHAAQMLDDGDLDPAHATGLKRRIDELNDFIDQLTEEAVA